jgi:phospholipid/cholesterol/gamma-HCH transport system substrate-binding protein
VPIIPTKPGALGEILNSAPVLVQRLATLTDRLSQLLSDDNQRSFQGILANSERLTGSLADQAPQLQLLIADSRRTVASAGRTADELAQLAVSGRNFVDSNGKPLADDLAKTLRSAQNSLAALDKAVQSARPGIDNLSTKTLPQVDQLVGDLQLLSRSIRSVTEQIEEGGAGSLLSAPPLPDYKPE